MMTVNVMIADIKMTTSIIVVTSIGMRVEEVVEETEKEENRIKQNGLCFQYTSHESRFSCVYSQRSVPLPPPRVWE